MAEEKKALTRGVVIEFDFTAIDFEGLWSGILKSLGLDSVF